MFYVCPKDASHQSEDADYCSVCGAKIGGAATSAPVLNGSSVGYDCGLTRPPGAKFCEVCRYNFDTHASAGAVPAPTAAPVADPVPVAAPAPAVLATTVPAIRTWEAVVTVDPSLYVDPDPAVSCPTDEPARTFPLDLVENLIGRRSDRRDIHPEVPLTDGGVSHRHAKILRLQDGLLVLLDVGSTNGTQLNGRDVPAGVRMPLADGDQITLGRWTRITVHAREV
jgi:hypothetical protein